MCCKFSSPKMFPNFGQFYSTFHKRQIFSLPISIIYYISKNPTSSKLYQKLIKSCKYFYIQNPILLIDYLSFNERSGWNVNFEEFNLKNISAKIWITFQLKISFASNKSKMNELISKLYKCDASILELKNVEIPSELFLTKNLKLCNFRNVSVLSKNGTKMPLEKIVENLPSIFGFKFTFGSNSLNVSSKTVEELIKIPHFSDISCFSLVNISENFDIQTLFDFLKQNSPKFELKYQNNRLSDKYKNELEKIVDEILETKYLKFDPPFISFPLQNEFKLAALRELFNKK